MAPANGDAHGISARGNWYSHPLANDTPNFQGGVGTGSRDRGVEGSPVGRKKKF